jgi:hypothetical protein
MGRTECHDALLAWASEVGSGSWEQWKDAAGALALEPNEAARTFSQLGHVEFDWGDNLFSCAPTTLVSIPGLDGQLLLTGARHLEQRDSLQRIALEADLSLELSEPIPQMGGRGPSTILVECDIDDGEAFAQVAGVSFEPAPQLLAASLPSLTLELVGEMRPPDYRFPHCRVDHKNLVPLWGQETAEGEEGLWLFQGYRRVDHYFRCEGHWWFLPIRDFGPFLAAPPDVYPPLLEYDEANWLVRTRSRAPLPPLQARALTLCSGRLPLLKRLGNELEETYVNVSPEVAKEIARSLAVQLEREDGE